jgi:Xaa-Pro aminopeptidase
MRAASVSLARVEGPRRLAAVRRRLDTAALDALIVSDPIGIQYLTGFPSDAFAVGLVADEWAVLVTVNGFAAEAQDLAAGYEPDVVPRGIWRRVADLLTNRLGVGARIGVQSEHLTHATFAELAGGLTRLVPELVPADAQLASLRAVKSDAELELLRAAAAPLGDVFAWLCERRLVGLTEREVAWTIERRLREQHGADGLAFPTVVACGPHGATPHHTASQTQIAQGELLVVDIGCVIDGYRSDMTRTLATGPLDSTALEAYELVRRAQRAALGMLAAGVVAESVHQTAAAVIAAGGHGERFLHGLGHGIGLELHEPPYCEPGATERLEVGQVLTVEPGVYLPGRLGVRIEDEVVITDGGYEPLTFFASELVACG